MKIKAISVIICIWFSVSIIDTNVKNLNNNSYAKWNLFHMAFDRETEYPLSTIVVSIDKGNDLVIVEDFNGNLWSFKGTEDWQKGDICSLIMSDNGTETIIDDAIVKAKYDGFVNGKE